MYNNFRKIFFKESLWSRCFNTVCMISSMQGKGKDSNTRCNWTYEIKKIANFKRTSFANPSCLICVYGFLLCMDLSFKGSHADSCTIYTHMCCTCTIHTYIVHVPYTQSCIVYIQYTHVLHMYMRIWYTFCAVEKLRRL